MKNKFALAMLVIGLGTLTGWATQNNILMIDEPDPAPTVINDGGYTRVTTPLGVPLNTSAQ